VGFGGSILEGSMYIVGPLVVGRKVTRIRDGGWRGGLVTGRRFSGYQETCDPVPLAGSLGLSFLGEA
jgi:hypothetical protein